MYAIFLVHSKLWYVCDMCLLVSFEALESKYLCIENFLAFVVLAYDEMCYYTSIGIKILIG